MQGYILRLDPNWDTVCIVIVGFINLPSHISIFAISGY
jgi:hypothetical protein